MKKMKKLITLLCAFAATFTMATITACSFPTPPINGNSSSASSSTESSVSSSASESSKESSVEASKESESSIAASTESSVESSIKSESNVESSLESSVIDSSEESSVIGSSTESDSLVDSSVSSSASESSSADPLPASYTFIVYNYDGTPAANVYVQLCSLDASVCFMPMLTTADGTVEYTPAGFVEGEYEIHVLASDMSTPLAFTGDTVTPSSYCEITLTLQNAPTWSEWEAKSQPTCTEEGEKTRYDVNNPTVTESAPIAARGHNYSQDNGTCVVCGEQAVIPALDDDQSFPLVEPCIHTDEQIYEGLCNCVYKGRGEEYSRVELTEGCYTVETIRNDNVTNSIWLSFSVQEAGQYMLYSVDNNKQATAARYDASSAFVSPVGEPARVDENGDFYSYVNCGEQYFNKEWRATFRINAKAGTLVKICFVKIDDPVWAPRSVYTYVYPTQINGQKAPEGGAANKKTEVPYDSKYYYSDPATGGDGYYHLESGELIYAAISSSPERLLLNGSFTVIHYEGSALNLSNGFNADGNYNILNYVPFIMNCLYDDDIFATDENENYLTDPTKNCYQNYCNSDGLYPVTAELFNFLNLYVQKNKPIDEEISDEAWKNQEAWLWLSACYYYTPITEGTQANPLSLTVGEYQIALPAADMFYCTIKEAGTYKITCSDNEVFIGDDLATSEATLVVTADAPLVFTFASMDSKTVTITVEKIEA